LIGAVYLIPVASVQADLLGLIAKLLVEDQLENHATCKGVAGKMVDVIATMGMLALSVRILAEVLNKAGASALLMECALQERKWPFNKGAHNLFNLQSSLGRSRPSLSLCKVIALVILDMSVRTAIKSALAAPNRYVLSVALALLKLEPRPMQLANVLDKGSTVLDFSELHASSFAQEHTCRVMRLLSVNAA